jgi:ribosomal protein S18 acetylase RimI-like enzyme
MGQTGRMSRPSADVSVRVAWADDADAIAAVQARAWRTSYDGLLPDAALEVDPARAAELWRTTLAQPKEARTRVLVALERNRVVGFAITTPATDPDCDPAVDAELMELTVDPGERGRGHGSRLVQAAVETMAADRFTRAVLWAVATDDALREFLTGAGWAPDTAHRELDLDGDGTTLVKQIRLHTDCSSAS